MSLHKFAEQVAAQGRGDDSLLVHMTPDEVQRLQAFAEANGRTMTINPTTGLPEAGFLSDLFKAVAPIALGAFLGPGAFGISGLGMSAGMAGLTVGGITTLATGSLSRGLMAGMGAYGGAGLAQGFADAGANALGAQGTAGVLGVEGAATGAGSQAAMLAEQTAGFGTEGLSRLADSARVASGASPVMPSSGALMSKGLEAAGASPMQFAKDNWKSLAAAASPILAGAMVPTTTKMPTGQPDPGYIRQQVYDPISQTYRSLTPVKANEWKDRSFSDIYRGYNGGGIVALAGGGMPGYAGGDLIPNRRDLPVNTNYVDEPYTALAGWQVEPPIGGGMPSEEELARKIALSSVTPDLIRTKTAGTTGGLDTLAANQNAAAITEAPPRPIAPDLTSPLIVPATPAPPVQGTSLAGTTGGLDTLAANHTAGATTGAATGTTGGIDTLAANQTAATTAAADAAAKAKLGVFQKVYDPKNGREFVSPAQAAQWGVTDYVTEMPMKLEFLNDTSRKAVTDTMAGGLTFEQAIDTLGRKYGMSGKDFYNYEVQGGLRNTGGKNAVATESGGLKPDELVAKLQAFKDKPPTTAQEFQEQQGLYADYRNRYANSSWNYANMGGKPQDYSLKPKDYLGLEFTGYAEPINFALSNMIQRGGQYKEMAKILTANPEINDVIDQLYKLNPEQSIFNSINPKYSELNANSASGFNTSLIRLAGDIERLGKDAAIQKFISQQQNLLSALPDAQGKLGNFNQVTMANPEYRALNAIKDSYTPRINDSAWNERVEKQKPIRDRVFGDIYRDPTTGKGLTVEYGKNGNPQSLVFFNQQGNRVSSGMIQNPEQLLEAAYKSGIPMSAVAQFAETIGKDVIKPSGGSSYWPTGLASYTLNDLASGKIANTIASDDWFNFMAGDTQAKNPESADTAVAKVKNYQKMARDYLADTTGTATTGTATTGAATTTAADSTGVAALLPETTGAPTTTADNTGVAALLPQATSLQSSVPAPPAQPALANAQAQVNNMYRNVLGRDADPTGLAFWSNAIASGRSAESIYQDFLASARSNTELVTADQIKNKTFAEATTPYKGYMSSDATNIVDEWVRNTLGREPTAADRQQQWYKDAADKMTNATQAKGLYDQFLGYAGTESTKIIADRIKAIDAELRAKGLTDADLLAQTGKTKQQLATEGIDLSRNLIGASQLAPAAKRTDFDLKAKLAALTPVTTTTTLPTNSQTNAPVGTTNPYGNEFNPGDITKNADGTITVQPNIPGRPYGGFTGMEQVRNAYTRGGGSLGYTPYTPKTAAEHATMYNTMTGDSQAAYKYLMGQGAYPTKSGVGEIAKPYREAVMGYPASTNKEYNYVNGQYVRNPDYVAPMRDASGNVTYGMSLNEIKSTLAKEPLSGQALYDWAMSNNVTAEDIADATGMKLSEVYAQLRIGQQAAAKKTAGTDGTSSNTSYGQFAAGGMMGYAVGGGLGSLGSYSDGGRLLRGPGDGVSDSIPATIGQKQQPARLADGEFVVPARIVSELGNGSTEAGAKKLYAMMDRVQRARGKTTGKNKVAANSRADKYLPA